ncbi:hypothetical protein NDU88_009444 [Pleurodeles waltl]|uniref:Uncharacterized protein n=1 Tax=Pleurodeles waltl TaxID=8319 RepID=A0AAV7QXC5_PLEWA|nr:hypothetical protein NDU88_009444 [Pleurodeles waltl]
MSADRRETTRPPTRRQHGTCGRDPCGGCDLPRVQCGKHIGWRYGAQRRRRGGSGLQREYSQGTQEEWNPSCEDEQQETRGIATH